MVGIVLGKQRRQHLDEESERCAAVADGAAKVAESRREARGRAPPDRSSERPERRAVCPAALPDRDT